MVIANSLNINQLGIQSFNNVSGVFTGVTLTGGTGISITNGNGQGGNPTISSSGLLTSVVTANATPQFVLAGTVETIDFGLSNLLLGSAGTGIVAPAVFNTSLGQNALGSLTSSVANTALGWNALNKFTTGATNFGGNTAIGISSLQELLTGIDNICISTSIAAGNNYTSSESSNILINNGGVTGESNVIRIGTQGNGTGQQDETFIAGIVGVTVANEQAVTINSSTGQMGIKNSSILSVAMTAAQSIAQNALVDVVYDTALIDTASAYNSGTGVYTVPVTGNYEITVTGNFVSTAGFLNGDLFVNKNAGTFLFHGSSTATVTDPNRTVISASIVVPLVAADTIKISMFAQTVGATNYTADGIANGFYNTMSIVRL